MVESAETEGYVVATVVSDTQSYDLSSRLTSVRDFRLLREFTAPQMGVDGDGGGGSREKGVRHLARVFKSPISLHKDQLSSSREEKREGGGVPYPRLFSFRSLTSREE